jgi:uncharacterized protein (TIGR00369 family)
MSDTSAPNGNRARILSMSGLAYMRAYLAGEIAGAAIAGPMNLRLTEVAEGRVAFEGRPDKTHINPMGAVHGGWFGTILDSAMGCAVMTTVPAGSFYTTLEYRVNITRALAPGDHVIAEAVVQHSGRTTAIARAELRGAKDGRLYATGSTTCLIMTAS